MTKKIQHSDDIFSKRIEKSKYREIIKSKYFKRLKNISFLGAVDPWLKDRDKDKKTPLLSSNRYNHSIGVFSIASEIIDRDDNFPEEETDLFLLTALLHDLGHGPLSHSVESVFDQKFGINHHLKTNELICSKNNEIREIIRSFRLHESDVTASLNGQANSYFKKYFQGHFNVDTLDGIYRCYSLFEKTPVYSLDTTINAVLMNYDTEKTENILDSFWQMKGWVYNLILYNGYGRIADEIALRAVQENANSIRADDFEKTDNAFYRSFPQLKEQIVEGVSKAISGNYVFHMHKTRPRTFQIKNKCRLDCEENIQFRYSQHKGNWVEMKEYSTINSGADSESELQYGLF